MKSFLHKHAASASRTTLHHNWVVHPNQDYFIGKLESPE